MTARTVLPWFTTTPATASPAGAISVRQSLQPYHPQTTAMDHNRLSPIPPSSSSLTTEDSVHNRSSSTQNHLNISLYSNPDSINALNRTYKDKKFVSKAGQLHLPEGMSLFTFTLWYSCHKILSPNMNECVKTSLHWIVIFCRSSNVAERGCWEVGSLHDGNPQPSLHPDWPIFNERKSPLPDDHRHVLSEGPPGWKNALQGLPVEALTSNVLDLMGICHPFVPELNLHQSRYIVTLRERDFGIKELYQLCTSEISNALHLTIHK